MREILLKAVDDWKNESPNAEARHGFVTDGNESFFQDGVLLTTCIFSTTLKSWVPVLWTWTPKRDVESHRPHFRYLFRQVVDQMGADFDRRWLANVRSTNFSPPPLTQLNYH